MAEVLYTNGTNPILIWPSWWEIVSKFLNDFDLEEVFQ
jgi:hypothetical protein